MEERWLSVDEICEYLGVSRDTAYMWLSKKGLPRQKVGDLWKFKVEVMDGWVRGGGAVEEPTAEPNNNG